MAAEIECEVNGKPSRLKNEGDTSLLLALRNDLELRGTRHGCATGNCGACTVLVSGRAVTSCDMPVDAVVGQSIETIEAFEDDDIGKALLAAFMQEQAGQCGYCLAGILIKAKALLATSEVPARRAVAAALDDHLCRCGAHNRILSAIERAAGELAKGEAA